MCAGPHLINAKRPCGCSFFSRVIGSPLWLDVPCRCRFEEGGTGGGDKAEPSVLCGLLSRAIFLLSRATICALRSSLLVATQIVERIEYRIDLLLGIWIDVLKAANQRDVFGT